ncbi:MAG: isoleucine--tRNA ligase [Armatimonadetes bacterium]|nr:isoleucine--tRNA ligase [Armatimonadota bacterium]
MNYRDTLNLPKTNFPMKANLKEKEPEILKFWEDKEIYQKLNKLLKGKSKYILHDGPPYSNGPIHLGQSLNKILKDIVVKYKTSCGFYSPFIPGWDTHGLPNEKATLETYKINRKEINPVELRERCKTSALHFLEIQKSQFKRLGIRGDWEHPYLTLNFLYESTIIKIFKELVKEGYIYKRLKPVYWCSTCETALAEAEIEYKEKESPSIFVKFPLKDSLEEFFPKNNHKTYVLIWTTTPWTLPGNVAIALNPEAYYLLVNDGQESYILAEELLYLIANEIKLKNYEILGKVKGKDLKGKICKHPFFERDSILITEEYVTLDQGTGCVHTAPGLGAEDYEAALKYSLPVIVPVNNQGILNEEAGIFKNLFYKEANLKIIEHLKESNLLLYNSSITHSYPHCWRCRDPIIFRATKQWFVAMDIKKLRENSLEQIKKVKWIPDWGEERIYNMLQARPDWCISRQRVWGVPIPVFYCKNCGEIICAPDIIKIVEDLFLKEGADVWFKKEAKEILPLNFNCPKCQKQEFEKENNIFDVWFESGVSHEAVCANNPELNWPADLYLEGSDQHRGWFQLSLIPAVAVRNKAPYRAVLTHGWVLDEQGISMHKSLGNVIDPNEIIKEYGGDILRLFFSSVDYTADIKIGKNTLKQISENYRKIRNTFRFILGNLYDFNPSRDKTALLEDLSELDLFILQETNQLLKKVKKAYDSFQFHLVYTYLHNFCVQDLSSFYLDIIKDTLYTYSANSKERKAVQKTLYEMLNALIIMFSPILSFTMEEIWQNLPWDKPEESIQLMPWPSLIKVEFPSELEEKWDIILSLRSEIFNCLEKQRIDKIIHKGAEAEVELYLEPPLYNTLRNDEELLRRIFLVSSVSIFHPEVGLPEGIVSPKNFPKIRIFIRKTKNQKCQRCWNYVKELSRDPEFADVCPHCGNVLEDFKAKK